MKHKALNYHSNYLLIPEYKNIVFITQVIGNQKVTALLLDHKCTIIISYNIHFMPVKVIPYFIDERYSISEAIKIPSSEYMVEFFSLNIKMYKLKSNFNEHRINLAYIL